MLNAALRFRSSPRKSTIADAKGEDGLRVVLFCMIATAALWVGRAYGQSPIPNWKDQVRRYAQAQDWESAMRIVEEQISRAPQDTDVRAWRARVLGWSGRFAAAEAEYREILSVSDKDADNWMGLAHVYLREGKIEEAKQAILRAEQLDPHRPDIKIERGCILRAAGERAKAESEFQKALELNPRDRDAHAGLLSVRSQPKQELRVGQNNDLLNYTSDYHDEWVTLNSQWTPRWGTSLSGDFYQRADETAEKFVGSVTRRQPKWGALTVGGAVGRDNNVIPRSEGFFEVDHAWKTRETGFLRGLELVYGQHWYWYQSARVLTLTESTVVYLPQEWTFTVGATGARSAFSGTAAEWRPSEIMRLAFPLARWGATRLQGNIYFALGSENFSVADQIGTFASQTYGGGLRFKLTERQEIAGYAGFQKRTQDRTDLNCGMSYAIYF